MTVRRVLAAVAFLALGGAAACSDDGPPGTDPGTPPGTSATPSVRTLSPIPAVEGGPPAGRLVADLRQSSRDAAAGRFQVWIGNGLDRPVRPVRLVYVDHRYLGPVYGKRLRSIPAGSERGFWLPLQDRPRCTDDTVRPPMLVFRSEAPRGSPVRHVRLDVEDEADVVARHVATRCFELELEQAVTLSVADEVVRRSEDVAVLTLRVAPTGRPGHRVTVRTVSGTPVLTPHRRAVWRPRAVVASDGEPVELALPVAPARCDGHAFAESGGATAFRVRLRLDGEPGEVVVRMSDRGAARALGFAQEICAAR